MSWWRQQEEWWVGGAVRRCVLSIGWFEDISMLWCFTAKKRFEDIYGGIKEKKYVLLDKKNFF
jgi:hypothetical protein